MENNIEKIFIEMEEKYGTNVAIITIVGALIVFLGLCFLNSWLVMLLWNWVAVDLFALPTLNFWSAFGLRWLCSLLFVNNPSIKYKEKE